MRVWTRIAWAAALSLAAACNSSTWGTAPGGDEKQDDTLVWSARAYPTGAKRTSAVLVERGMPAEVQSGQRYEYELRVTNLTDQPITDVVLMDTAPAGFEVAEDAPAAEVTDGTATWMLGALEGDAEVTVRASALAGEPGELRHESHVSWHAPLPGVTTVVQPELDLERTVPEVVVLVDGIPITYEVTNAGTGLARDVVIEESLPEGFTVGEGEGAIRIDVGALPAGETRSYTRRVRAAGTGVFESAAASTGFGGLSDATEPTTVQVTQPVLRGTASAPTRAAIGQVYPVAVTLGNAGDGPARDTTVSLTIPVGTALVESAAAGDGTAATVRGQTVSWLLGTIEAGQERTVEVKLRAVEPRVVQHHVLADAHGADEVTLDPQTELYGIATVNIAVRDEADPIQVGNRAVYLVSVVNQGTAPATNVRVVCRMEEGMALIEAGGASAGTAENGSVTLEPVASMAPKTTLTWRVVVRGDRAGDRRFTVAVNADQLDRPVEASESTRFFE